MQHKGQDLCGETLPWELRSTGSKEGIEEEADAGGDGQAESMEKDPQSLEIDRVKF